MRRWSHRQRSWEPQPHKFHRQRTTSAEFLFRILEALSWKAHGLWRKEYWPMFRKNAIKFSISTIVLAALFFVAPALRAYTDLDAERVSQLLSKAKEEALQLKLDAAEMESFTRSQVSWESHADKLSEIKEHVNKVGETVNQLNAARSGAAPWQKVAIGRVNPLMAE